MLNKLDDLIERLPWTLYKIVRAIQYYPAQWRRICIYCVDCEEDAWGPHYETHWYCHFREDKEVDWQDTCRAFKRK